MPPRTISWRPTLPRPRLHKSRLCISMLTPRLQVTIEYYDTRPSTQRDYEIIRRKMGETAAVMDLTTSQVNETLSTTLSSRLVLKCWRKGDELADLCYTWSRPQRQRGYDPTLTSSSTSSWGRAPTLTISSISTSRPISINNGLAKAWPRKAPVESGRGNVTVV